MDMDQASKLKTLTRGKTLKWNIPHVLFLLSYLVPFVGIVVSPTIVWPVTFALVVAWVLLSKYEVRGALAMLWGVQVEPAPCDILFIYAWLKRLISRKLAWPGFIGLHMFLFFVFLNVLQLFLVQDLQRGLWFAGATAYTISLSFLFASGIRTQEEFKAIQRYYLAAVIVTAGVTLLLASLHLVGIGNHLGQLYYANRPKGFFKDPNVAGAFVVTGALFALSQLIFRRRKLMGWYGLLFLMLTAAVIATFSRGALVNLLLGIALLGILALWHRRGLRFVTVVALAVVFAVPLILMLLETFGQAWRFRGLAPYDVYGRFAAWKAGIQIFADAPWGIGPGQFEVVSPEYQQTLSLGELIVTPSAHNTYLRALVENGVIGFVVLFTGLLAIFGNSLRTALLSKESNSTADAAWLCSSLGGILVESFVIDTLHWRHLWIITGLVIAYYRLMKKAYKGFES